MAASCDVNYVFEFAIPSSSMHHWQMPALRRRPYAAIPRHGRSKDACQTTEVCLHRPTAVHRDERARRQTHERSGRGRRRFSREENVYGVSVVNIPRHRSTDVQPVTGNVGSTVRTHKEHDAQHAYVVHRRRWRVRRRDDVQRRGCEVR